MGLSGGSSSSTTNQTQTAQTATNQYQTAQQLAAQLQSQFGGQNVDQTQSQVGSQSGNQSQSYNDTNGPSAFAQPFIQQALDAAKAGYNPGQANATGASINALIPSLIEKFSGSSSAFSPTRDYLTSTMNDNGSNPNLAALISQTNSDVANKVNAAVGSRGGAGGSAQTQLLARELARNEAGLRYNDFTAQQARRDAAARSLADLAGQETSAGSSNLASLLAAAQAGTSIPQNASNSFASTIAQLLANATSRSGTSSGTTSGTSGSQTSSNTTGSSYNNSSSISGGNTSGTQIGNSNVYGTNNGTTNTQQSGSFLDSLLQIGATLGSAALMSDRRLKHMITKVGEYADGLGVYVYAYLGSATLRCGVLAQEVAELRPWALGPEVAGLKSVNYAMLEA